jgi:hypothetical protein
LIPAENKDQMKMPDAVGSWFTPPVLTQRRIWFAFIVSGITDGLQILAGPAGWVVLDQVLDIIAMVLTSRALGFHPLLLPTFVVELIPMADMLPTWTGCTAAVVMLRRRAAPPPPRSPPTITVDEPPPPAPPSPPKQLT